MDRQRFDNLTRAVSALLSRRTLAGALAFGALGLPQITDAKKRRHKRKKKIDRNEFGCVDVGKRCAKNKQCCSSICKGKHGKKTCRAHDASTCQAGQLNVNCGGVDVDCTNGDGNPGICNTTTGNAPYCASSYYAVACRMDADCQPFCGPRAACLTCGYYSPGPTCAGPEACSGPV